jgi:hypothetical protein
MTGCPYQMSRASRPNHTSTMTRLVRLIRRHSCCINHESMGSSLEKNGAIHKELAVDLAIPTPSKHKAEGQGFHGIPPIRCMSGSLGVGSTGISQIIIRMARNESAHVHNTLLMNWVTLMIALFKLVRASNGIADPRRMRCNSLFDIY